VAAHLRLEWRGAQQCLQDHPVDAPRRGVQPLAQRGLELLVGATGRGANAAGGDDRLHDRAPAQPCSTRLALLPPKPKKLASSRLSASMVSGPALSGSRASSA